MQDLKDVDIDEEKNNSLKQKVIVKVVCVFDKTKVIRMVMLSKEVLKRND